MINLRQGDCLELMKDIGENSVDFVFTDPPYKLTAGGRKNSMLRGKSNNTPFSTNGECFNSKTPNFEEWVSDIYRILKPNNYAVIMINDKNLFHLYNVCKKSGFSFCELLVMKKNNKVPSLYFFKQCEYLLLLRKGNYKKFNKYGVSNLFEVIMPKGKYKSTPTEKPIEFIQTIIECLSKKDDVVFDPFCGSGSTGVACVNTNRNFIGIELDENYFTIAKERIEEAQNKKCGGR